jgi:hypothetical protein
MADEICFVGFDCEAEESGVEREGFEREGGGGGDKGEGDGKATADEELFLLELQPIL